MFTASQSTSSQSGSDLTASVKKSSAPVQAQSDTVAPKRLGEILVDAGWITTEDLKEALIEAKRTGQYIGAVLIKKDLITKEQLGRALAKQFNINYHSLANLEIDPKVFSLLPVEFIESNQAIPIAKDNGQLVVAMVDPSNRRVLDEITFITGMRPQAVVTTSVEFHECFVKHTESGPTYNLVDEITNLASNAEASQDEQMRMRQQMEMMDTSNPLIKLVNSLIEEGIERNASDIHIEPKESGCQVRFRIDGILQTILEIPANMESSFITRIKVMSRMDIADQRRPQDGRIALQYKEGEYNLRVNTLPIGDRKEKICMRILRPSKNNKDLSKMGMSPDEVKKVEMLYKSPYGIVLVCGPTGSGKTTTLYTILNNINEPTINISTVEDPIELRIPGLNQSQVNTKADFTFATALRALLRQDPDVIMVGEIRDLETLEVSIHASLTGHLVLSTIHSNSTSATVTRLVEMGADASMVTSSLLGVIAQRLARTLCDECKVPYEASMEEKALIFPKHPEHQQRAIKLHRAGGCSKCQDSGYSGRAGLYEIMMMDRTIKKLIFEHKSDVEIEDAAVSAGMKTLYKSGLELLVKGRTSIDELVRILGPTLGRSV